MSTNNIFYPKFMGSSAWIRFFHSDLLRSFGLNIYKSHIFFCSFDPLLFSFPFYSNPKSTFSFHGSLNSALDNIEEGHTHTHTNTPFSLFPFFFSFLILSLDTDYIKTNLGIRILQSHSGRVHARYIWYTTRTLQNTLGNTRTSVVTASGAWTVLICIKYVPVQHRDLLKNKRLLLYNGSHPVFYRLNFVKLVVDREESKRNLEQDCCYTIDPIQFATENLHWGPFPMHIYSLYS